MGEEKTPRVTRRTARDLQCLRGIIDFSGIIVYIKLLLCGLVIELMKMESIAGPLEMEPLVLGMFWFGPLTKHFLCWFP